MIDPSEKLGTRFESRYLPSTLKKAIEMVDQCARDAEDFVARRYPNGNNAIVQGHVRRQDIFEGLKVANFLGCRAETYNYAGYLLGGDERVQNFTLLVSHNDTGLLIARVNDRYERQPAVIWKYMAGRNTSLSLFRDDQMYLRPDISHIERFYILAYDLDTEDPSGATIGNVQVLTPSGKDRQHQILVPDAREYALRPDPVTGQQVPIADDEQLAAMRSDQSEARVEGTNDPLKEQEG